MRIARLADFLDFKYQLVSTAVDPRPEVLQDIRKSLRDFREVHLEGKGVLSGVMRQRAGIVRHLSRPENTEPEFQELNKLVAVVADLGVHPAYNKLEMYAKVQEALTLAAQLMVEGVDEIGQILRLREKGTYRNPEKESVEFQQSQLRGFLETLTSVYKKIRDRLAKYIDKQDKDPIDEISVSSDGKRIPQPLRKATILNFTRYYADAGKPYGLDDIEFVRQLYHQNYLRPLLETLIRSIKKGNKPQAPPAILSQRDSFEEKKRKLIHNLRVLGVPEEEFKQYLDLPRQQEEAEKAQEEWQKLTPGQQWSKQLQEAKKQKLLEQEEHPSTTTPEQMQQLVEQRDLEHEQRLQKKKEEEEALISKYNGLTFEQWIRRGQ